MPTIIGTLPFTLTNGTTADATQVQDDLQFIVDQVNVNVGILGSYDEATVPIGSPVGATSGVPVNITAFSLPAGDWDVSGGIGAVVSSSLLTFAGSVSMTSSALEPTNYGGFAVTPTSSSSGGVFQPLGLVRYVLAAPTNIFLVGQAGFVTGTVGLYGRLRARRVQ